MSCESSAMNNEETGFWNNRPSMMVVPERIAVVVPERIAVL